MTRKARSNYTQQSFSADYAGSYSNDPALRLDPTLDLTPADFQLGYKTRKEWTWGKSPDRVLDWKDPDYPELMTACGHAVRFQYRLPDSKRHPRRERDHVIQLEQAIADKSFIAFDTKHKHQRLYFCLDARACRDLKKEIYDELAPETYPLGVIASIIGGRHGNASDYPNVNVKVIGVLTGVMYATEKVNDGPSVYLHQLGEISHHPPALCVDARGRLWCAGGNYTAPIPGITD